MQFLHDSYAQLKTTGKFSMFLDLLTCL